MRIGITSDTHGDYNAWVQMTSGVFAGCEQIIHVGDVLYHGPRNPLPPDYRPAKLASDLEQRREVLIARGNCDSAVDQKVLELPYLPECLFLVIDGLRFLVCHGHDLPAAGVEALIQRHNLDVVITGHTHVPLLGKIGQAVHLNPGSPSLPKGEAGPTAALYEDGELKLFSLKNGSLLSSLELSKKTPA